MTKSSSGSDGWSGRCPSILATLLLELGGAVAVISIVGDRRDTAQYLIQGDVHA